MKNIVLSIATSAVALFAASASAQTIPSNPFGTSPNLFVNGYAAPIGSAATIFNGGANALGTNYVFTEGTSDINIAVEDNSFCGTGTCDDTGIVASLLAGQQGVFETEANDASGGALSVESMMTLQNAGGLQTQYDGNLYTATVFANGMAGNLGGAAITGGNGETAVTSFGDGTAGMDFGTPEGTTVCPTCQDFVGGSFANMSAGMIASANANGTTLGDVVSAGNSFTTTFAAALGADFVVTPVTPATVP